MSTGNQSIEEASTKLDKIMSQEEAPKATQKHEHPLNNLQIMTLARMEYMLMQKQRSGGELSGEEQEMLSSANAKLLGIDVQGVIISEAFETRRILIEALRTVRQYRTVVDSVYRHNAAGRQAVIRALGGSVHKISDELTMLISQLDQEKAGH